MQMREEKYNLLDNLDYLLFEHKDRLPETLSKYNLKELEDLRTIVSNALNGKKQHGLYKITYVRNYLIDSLKYVHENYDYDNYDEQEDLELLLKEIIIDLHPKNFIKISNLVTSDELIGMKSLARQKRLPREIESEIVEFVGQKQTGGKKKSKKKSKVKRRTHTKKRSHRG
jgi:hypothetical protein